MAIGLVLFAIVLFMSCLYLAVGTNPAAPGKNIFNADGGKLDMEELKFIVVNLPKTYLAPENYTLDIKVTLHRGKDDAAGGRSDLHGRRYNRQLDEYL